MQGWAGLSEWNYLILKRGRRMMKQAARKAQVVSRILEVRKRERKGARTSHQAARCATQLRLSLEAWILCSELRSSSLQPRGYWESSCPLTLLDT